MGATLADGNGFFWTTLYDALGDQAGLGEGVDVAIYHNGTQEANVTLRPIVGSIDVVNDTVAGLAPARPQPQWAIDAHGGAWTEPANIVTNGPYRLTHFQVRAQIYLPLVLKNY